jgi:hypothetical protein
VDRSSGVPVTTEFPRLSFPALERATLANGVKVVLAQRHDVPVVQMNLELRGGFLAARRIRFAVARVQAVPGFLQCVPFVAVGFPVVREDGRLCGGHR